MKHRVDVWKLVGPIVSIHRLVLLFPDVYRFPDPSVHRVAFSSLSIILARSQSVTWFKEMAWTQWSATTDLFCSVAADLLALRVYAFTSRCVTSCRCSCSRIPKALPVSPM